MYQFSIVIFLAILILGVAVAGRVGGGDGLLHDVDLPRVQLLHGGCAHQLQLLLPVSLVQAGSATVTLKSTVITFFSQENCQGLCLITRINPWRWCAMRKEGFGKMAYRTGIGRSGPPRSKTFFYYFSHLSDRHLVFNQLTFLLIKANSWASSIMYKMKEFLLSKCDNSKDAGKITTWQYAGNGRKNPRIRFLLPAYWCSNTQH